MFVPSSNNLNINTDYDLYERNALIEIAKIAVRQNGRAFSYIQNYGIENQDTLMAIVQLAAPQLGQGRPVQQSST